MDTNTGTSLSRILKIAGAPSNCTQPVAIQKIDMSRPFAPEEYTQLYYTPIYGRLTDNQKLRYNQLFGVRNNEYIMMLERDLVERILVPLCHHPKVAAQSELLQCLRTMIEEERRHYVGFLDLNRRCLPDIFVDGRERYFSELSFATEMTFRVFGQVSSRLAFPLYYVMALEESSMAMARSMIKRSSSEALGELEPQFVSVHREHMKDEARHVQIDKHLVEACLTRTGRLTRWINARLFKYMLRGITRVGPNGSGAKVIRRLVQEMPELASMEAEMISAIMALTGDAKYQRSLFNRKAMPLTFGIFDQAAEFDDLQQYMVGYERN